MYLIETRDLEGRTVQRRLNTENASPVLRGMPDGWTTTSRLATQADVESIRDAEIHAGPSRQCRRHKRPW